MASPPADTLSPLSTSEISGVAIDPTLLPVRGDHVDVWEGTYQGSRVAIRYYKISAEDELEDVKKRFYGEVVVWKRLIHRNIVPFLGVAASSDPISRCMVSPWMENGKLRQYLIETPEADRHMLLMDVVGGIEYLHLLDIIHGNLKADNILIDSSGRARISGFGRACIATDVEAIKDWTTLLATWRWMAPEVLLPDTVVASSRGPSKASDIYAFGMVALELFSGRLPFHGVRETAIVTRVMEGMRPNRPDDARGLSDEIWGLVEQCWQQERANRPTISSVLNVLQSL